MIHLVTTLRETKKIAKEFAQKIKNIHSLIIFLEGDLGSGKTTFTRYVLNYLNIKDFKGSPSFALVNEYTINNLKLFHMDLYRINSKETLVDIGIYEYFKHCAIFFIEWPNLLEIKPDIVVKFSLANTYRSIEIDWC